jgi:hypothetical protein
LTSELSFDDDYEELLLPSDDKDAQDNIKFGTFKSEHLSNHVFKVGMIFESMMKLGAAITWLLQEMRAKGSLCRTLPLESLCIT